MRTVREAIIEFKGEWEGINTYLYFCGTKSHWYHCCEDTLRSFHGSYYLVCTKRQFSVYVELLASNMGRATQTYEEYKKEHESVEVDYTSEEFWKDAPEWAVDIRAYASETKGHMYTNGYNTIQDIGDTLAYPVLRIDQWKVIATRPQPKPVYTQAMCDKGELPSVGMECTSYKNKTTVYIFQGLTSNGKAILEHEKTGGVYATPMVNIAAIDTRTDKEKACDAIWKELDDSGVEYDLKTAMELAYDRWSPKPLTVEVE